MLIFCLKVKKMLKKNNNYNNYCYLSWNYLFMVLCDKYLNHILKEGEDLSDDLSLGVAGQHIFIREKKQNDRKNWTLCVNVYK